MADIKYRIYTKPRNFSQEKKQVKIQTQKIFINEKNIFLSNSSLLNKPPNKSLINNIHTLPNVIYTINNNNQREKIKRNYSLNNVSNNENKMIQSAIEEVHKFNINKNKSQINNMNIVNNQKIICGLRQKINYLNEDINEKNKKINYLEKQIDEIKSSTNISTPYLIKSQLNMINVLNDQNKNLNNQLNKQYSICNDLKNELEKYKDEVEKYKNELKKYKLNLINNNNNNKRNSNKSSNYFEISKQIYLEYNKKIDFYKNKIVSNHKINNKTSSNSTTISTSNSTSSLFSFPKLSNLCTENELIIFNKVLSIYLKNKVQNKNILFDYLNKDNFCFDDFIDLIFKSISMIHWKSSNEHFYLLRLIIDLSNNNSRFDKEKLKIELSNLYQENIMNNANISHNESENNISESLFNDTNSINNIINYMKNLDILNKDSISVMDLYNIFLKFDVDDRIFFRMISEIKNESFLQDNDIDMFSISLKEIEDRLMNKNKSIKNDSVSKECNLNDSEKEKKRIENKALTEDFIQGIFDCCLNRQDYENDE